MPKLIH